MLPNLYDDPLNLPIALFETGSLSVPAKTGQEPAPVPEGAVLRFQDFVERPLRSSSPSRQAEKGRGRPTG